MIRPFGAAAVLLFGACASAPAAAPSRSNATLNAPNSALSASSADVAATVGVATRVCPTFRMDDLEPKNPEPDTTMVALTAVFPRLETRHAGAGRQHFELGRIELPVSPTESTPPTRGIGMGWQTITREWVESGLRPEILASFDALMKTTEKLNDTRRLHSLLAGRLNELEVVPADTDGFLEGCVRSGLARAERDAAELLEPRAAETATLLALLEGAAQHTPEETYVLADLLLQSRTDPTAKTVRFARPLDLFYTIAANQDAPNELRARALEQTARIYFETDRSKPGIAALEHVLAITKDDDLRGQMFEKLADLGSNDEGRENYLKRLVALETPQGHGYPLSRDLGQLAQVRYARGDLVGAIETAAHCARTESGDFVENVDPWYCAETLAEAMAELGGAPDNIEVPVSFLGPLGASVMASSSERLDRDLVMRAANLLLERAPMAAEAPIALFRLRALAKDPAQAAALTERLERDYGPTSVWNTRQVARLARSTGRAGIVQAIEVLRSPPYELLSPRPTSSSDLEEEVHERLDAVAFECAAALGRPAKDVTVTFDTRGTVPTAVAQGVTTKLRACLARGAKSHFRSLGPSTVRVTLHPTP